MKQAILAVAILGLLARVYFVYYGATLPWAAKTAPPSAVATVPGTKKAAPTPTPDARAVAAADAERKEIDGAIKALHLTTIMPGQPGLIIVDKEEYSEGESLPLPKGRKAKIVAVQDDGVQLTCNGTAYHLDAPAEPDLAASRKKR